MQDVIDELAFGQKRTIIGIVVDRMVIQMEGDGDIFCGILVIDLSELQGVIEHDEFYKQLCYRAQ